MGDRIDESRHSDGSAREAIARELLDGAMAPSAIARRGFVLAGLSFLAACASGGATQSVSRAQGSSLPPGLWTSEGKLPPQRFAQPATPRNQPPAAVRAATDAQKRVVGPSDKPSSKPASGATAKAGTRELPNGYNGTIIARDKWTPFCPNVRDMNPMGSIRKITVHHTGNDVFTAAAAASVREELQTVLRGEMAVGHDDIAYHYIIDPAGRVWEGRSMRYQGSHVRNWKGVDNRTGNIGVMLLGNFEEQRPTKAQLVSVEAFVKDLQKKYGIPRQTKVGGRISKDRGVFTHQELSPTLCPGRNLQGTWKEAIFPRLRA
jgi:hypothetical protein